MNVRETDPRRSWQMKFSRRLAPQTGATPRFHTDNCYKARKSLFELVSPFTILIRPEFTAYRSEELIYAERDFCIDTNQQ
jgi:hypothetical protein